MKKYIWYNMDKYKLIEIEDICKMKLIKIKGTIKLAGKAYLVVKYDDAIFEYYITKIEFKL